MTRSTLWILAVVALAAAACGDQPAGPVAGEEYADMPADQVIFAMDHYMTTDGVRRARVQADTAFLDEDSASLSLRQVHLLLYNENGSQAAELTSLAGSLDTQSNRMIARGNVVLVTTEGDRRIETPELYFDQQADRIWSDSTTVIYEGGTRLVGEQGFTSDSRMKNVQILQPRGRVEGLKLRF